MSVTTYTHLDAAAPARPSFLRRMADAVVAARMADARRQINSHLLTLTDAELAKHGYDRATLKRYGAAPFRF